MFPDLTSCKSKWVGEAAWKLLGGLDDGVGNSPKRGLAGWTDTYHKSDDHDDDDIRLMMIIMTNSHWLWYDDIDDDKSDDIDDDDDKPVGDW